MNGNTYPVYLLRIDKEWRIVLPENRADIGHTDFWEQTVSRLVATHFKIPQANLANLPYCQRRARIVGNTAYYGGRPEPDLLKAIRKATGNTALVFSFDEHERRLREDVREFRRLVRRPLNAFGHEFVPISRITFSSPHTPDSPRHSTAASP